MKLMIPAFRFPQLVICFLVGATSLLFQGCLGVKSYVDPTLPKVNHAELKPSSSPQPLRFAFEFQTNGKLNKRATKFVLPKVTSALETSRLFSSLNSTNNSKPESECQLSLILNNVADIGAAFGKGFGTGLTFGAAGTLVTDGYVLTATLEQAGKDTFKREYRHAIHSTVGNKKGPEGLEPMTTDEAVDRVVEQLVLNLLRDLQAADRL